MVEFKIDKNVFKNLLSKCSMSGVVQFRDGKGIKKPFFSSFYLDINPTGRIEMLAMDTIRKKTISNVILKDVKVIKDGNIPIMDYESITKCLSGKGISGEITVKTNGSILTLESDTDFYEIRQKDNPDIKNMKKKSTIKKLESWKTMHKFDGNNGMLIMHHSDQDVEYPMRIEVKKEDLIKLTGDALNITKDNTTTLIFKDGVLSAHKGEGNANIKSKHTIDCVDTGEEFIEFEEKFYSLQTILPNLFDKIELNIRRSEKDKTINIMVRSIDDKSKMEICIGLASIKKGK